MTMTSQEILPKSNEHLNQQKFERLHFVFRFFFGAMIGIAHVVFISFFIDKTEVKGIDDRGIKFLQPLNDLVHNNTLCANLLLTYSTLLCDIFISATFFIWCAKSRNLRYPMCFISFHVIRALVQEMFHMEKPVGLLWYDPGYLPSFSVSYEETTDFFFSSHVGALTICFFEHRALGGGLKKFAWLFLFPNIFIQALIVLTFRVHYSIDVIAGFVFAHYLFIMCDWVDKPINASVNRMLNYFCKNPSLPANSNASTT